MSFYLISSFDNPNIVSFRPCTDNLFLEKCVIIARLTYYKIGENAAV